MDMCCQLWQIFSNEFRVTDRVRIQIKFTHVGIREALSGIFRMKPEFFGLTTIRRDDKLRLAKGPIV